MMLHLMPPEWFQRLLLWAAIALVAAAVLIAVIMF
jgi:hypothetical protein